MRPKSPSPSATDDLFRNRLSNILDQRHALLRLAGLINWSRFEQEYGALYAEHGRPGLPTRLMVGLHLLKHIKALSDEQVCAQWVENPYFQASAGKPIFSTNCRWSAPQCHAGASASGRTRSRRCWRKASPRR
jgi:IS5 family transposase